MPYYPSVVHLSGTLTLKIQYGPPGFRENPKSDSKLAIYVVKLDYPVGTQGKADNPDGFNSYSNIKYIQLSPPSNKSESELYKENVGKHVYVTGQLYEASTPDKFTKVLILVNKLEEIK